MTIRARRTPQRYQLDKRTLAVLSTGHPWIFRDRLSSAAAALADGQWLRLVDGSNATVGHGIHEAEGAIGIRVLSRGPDRPGAAWAGVRLAEALARRAALRTETDAYRAVHGESDGLPAVVFDVYGDVGVLQTYSLGADGLGRHAAAWLRRELGLTGVLWKPATRRRGAPRPTRVLAGTVPDLLHLREGDRRIAVDLRGGQKSGAFLDLRGLRRWVAAQPLAGARVLNLFAYTGTLAQSAAAAGAAEIWNVDQAAAALAFARDHHAGGAAAQRFIDADVFDWLPHAGASVADLGRFDLVIVDPPSMTSRAVQAPRVLDSYRRLYHAARALLAPGGRLVVACCTSRISRGAFRDTADRALSDLRCVADLPPEPDHPVAFPESDYLKVRVYGPRV
jgi:23S rRNA G2069 N7-methylase RlmK/C1962 C5-methylase RlmI